MFIIGLIVYIEIIIILGFVVNDLVNILVKYVVVFIEFVVLVLMVNVIFDMFLVEKGKFIELNIIIVDKNWELLMLVVSLSILFEFELILLLF